MQNAIGRKATRCLAFSMLMVASTPGCDDNDVSPSDTGSSEETSGDGDGDTGDGDGDGDTGDGDSGDGDGDGDAEPQPCTWTDFPTQYGIGSNLGEKCGELSGSATQADFDLVFACLADAYDANVAAYATVDWYDGGDASRKVRWYVRPPEDDGPRHIETLYFKAYVEEGPPSTGSLEVRSCSDFGTNCEAFPSEPCAVCQDPTTMACLEE